MKLTLFLILSCNLPPLSGATKLPEVWAWMGDKAVLPCVYREERFSDHRFSWQLGKIVIYSFKDGGPQEGDMDNLYRSRTILAGNVSKGDLSILIRNVGLNDQGVYHCHVIATQPEMRKVHDCKVKLLVTANYSHPVIKGPDSEFTEEGQTINLTCMSWGGYPEPKVSWMDGDGRSLTDASQVNQTRADTISGFFNVSSWIQVKTTPNSSYTCTVLNTRTGEKRSSAPWNANFAAKVTPSPLRQDHMAAITVVSFGLVFLLAALGFFVWKSFQKHFQGERRGGEEAFNSPMDQVNSASPDGQLVIDGINGVLYKRCKDFCED